ncbi:ff611315-7492-4d8f-99ef-6a73d230e119 [Thermothielavioides terrestris]|uniref:Ff611315-7492-4d8f-99ef-6a73d230e119 n=1 Tax=Thermothielavioides terrestris TaxID=2587410 RepID=A0A446BK50_9PEZI|nr:ff611315-7492-4d8f-99ef-6a73d230e119 [Thermothielavioides terrestris]
MLNKKSAFKPKAAVRRPAAGPASQGAQRSSATEPSKAPAPQDQDSSSQPQSAPLPVPSAAPDVHLPARSENDPNEAAEPRSHVHEKQPESPAVEPKVQAKRIAVSSAVVLETNDERSASVPANVQPENVPTQSVPVVQQPAQSAVPVGDAESRSRKRSRSATENGEAEADGERDTAGQPKRRPPPRAHREATPPDAENVEIDITQVKMADLAKDMHIGKKFSLHDELMERERAKRMRYNERRRRRQNGDEDVDGAENRGSPADASSANSRTSAQATPAPTDTAAANTPTGGTRAPIGEQYQLIGGEIVLDHRSLQVDRHARAREEAGELLEVEENDFSHHTTSATYLRRNLKPQQWTDEETELFYQALSAFGTDFDTICRMFKGKTRKHIKLKFNREERLAPARINAALVGQKTVSIDMEQYQRATGQEYETAEAIYAEQQRAEEEFEARQKALEDEKAEEARRKREEVQAQLDGAVNGEGAKKGRGKGRKKAARVVGL